MNYTKGDWKAYKDTFSKDCFSIELKHTGHEKQYTEIAMAYHSCDAGLISAAPEMYEALQKAINEIERLSMVTGYTGEAHFPIIETIKKALRKAEGN